LHFIEAKSKLSPADKTIKEITWKLGFEDGYYFSRFYKVSADVSPQLYRDGPGYARTMA